ncbi:MAG: metal-dependent transcriptional regulator [Planctomycetaceae bacterium]|jgi:DtxR family Mn-dependent transcriptional regulator|nr:metal-dependent transcriptional regulator [Planctomycetaceae bacterium]
MPANIMTANALTGVMEDYLEAIYHIVKEKGYARSKHIIERLGMDKSTVTTALHTLKTLGYINYEPYRDVTLTEKGEQEGQGIVRRHDTLFRLLHELLHVDADDAQKLACDMEHALSPGIAEQFTVLVEKALERNKKCIHQAVTDGCHIYRDIIPSPAVSPATGQHPLPSMSK